MNKSILLRLLGFVWFCLPFGASALAPPLILPPADPGTDPTHRIIWSTEPGIRYELQQSTDLDNWTTVAGFPSKAQALAQQHKFEASGDRLFFRIIELDEQPPEIMGRSPADAAFGVPRFGAIEIDLQDRTGIDAASVSLTVGDHGSFTISDPVLSLEGATLVFDLGGDFALGAYGDTVDVSLSVADTLGNAATYAWSFELERQIQLAENIFVFGSPDAQRAGQRLSGVSATIAVRFAGPVRTSGSTTEWTLTSVTADTVVVSYSSDSAPRFTVNQKITNLAPSHVDEIFYRLVTAVAIDEGERNVTLSTSDLALPDFMPEGSFNIGEGAIFLEVDEIGNVIAMRSFTVELPSIGADFSGQTLFTDGPLTLSLSEGRALFHSSVSVSLDNVDSQINRFSARVEGRFDLAVVPQLTLSGAYNRQLSRELWSSSYWIWTSVGLLPVPVEVTASITANAGIDVSAQAEFTTGFRQTASVGVAGSYIRDATPSVKWNRSSTINPMRRAPFTYTVSGQGSATVSLVPQLDVRLFGAGGINLNTNPRSSLRGSATITDGKLIEAEWLLGAYADLNAGLSVIGLSGLPALSPFTLFTREWTVQPGLRLRPEIQPVSLGDPFSLFVDANDISSSGTFEWYKNGDLVQYGGEQLLVNRADYTHSGSYHVQGAVGGLPIDSEFARVLVNMVLIPEGSFEMGQADSWPEVRPVHSVHVSTFYMGRTAVTKAQWDAVRSWAVNNGYIDLPAGGGKGPDHPVHTVSWLDAVKWLNAWSEREGLQPVYQVSGAVMKTGTATPTIDYSANGYRLPTEAEWEKAARGGLHGRRYPWGDTISHSDANYSAYGDIDDHTQLIFHPDYNDGTRPYTSPVGSFAANGYGLYDMAGNIAERCNDWYDGTYYSSSPEVNPGGPSSGTYRVVRGGSYAQSALGVQVFTRGGSPPDTRDQGFRPARSSVP